jgi:hypothetical protein
MRLRSVVSVSFAIALLVGVNTDAGQRTAISCTV